ncbi:Nuclear speckle splicing regulatory protein 1 [Araneus ventricosus]|uniref:Nuclear speckle splicing regulatory protein 1 n=1 Tax=Araneus ventricosus TaxID=182803 RepID=A0A4Y2E996_ARAVE|nr:Nuclear speckle splicing regulatory protein 1 [Araneus ventricosus]
MDKSKPFGLVIPKKTKAFQAKKISIFDSDSDDEQPARKKPTPIPQAKPLSKKLEQKELCEDPSIYEYDSIYDDMKAQEVAKIAGPKDKPSRYIDTLLKAADKRKKEYERRIERKVQVEREKEGDKFKDKEAFVTSSYKKKMQEMEEAEERERRENMLNDMMDVTKQNDLSGFYRHFLKQSVGEEKVPVFGEKRTIKEEPKSDDEDEKRNYSVQGKNPESDEEKDKDLSSKKKKEDNKEAKYASKASHSRPKMYRKGRSDSDNEETPNPSNEAEETHNTANETTNITDPNLDADSDIVSSCEEDEESNLSKSKEDSLKDNISANNSKVCSGSDSEKGNSKQRNSVKNIRKRTNDDSSDSSESSKENEENCDSSVNETSLNGHPKPQDAKAEDADESEKPKPKRNMLEKRTVGEVFAAAQARYFQRLAVRNG